MLWDGFFMHILFSYPSGEQEFMQSVSKVKSFFAAHKAARVLLVIAAALLAFVLIFHPHGTKTYLITGIDNYGSLNDNGRSDVMLSCPTNITKTSSSTPSSACRTRTRWSIRWNVSST